MLSAMSSSERNRVSEYRATQQMELISDERADLESRIDELEGHFKDLESKVVDLIDSLDEARNERDILTERLTEIESGRLNTKEHPQKYLDSMRQCCSE